MNEIRIGSRIIGETYRPFIIAEMSGNHNKSLHSALDLVKAAVKAGAHAVKLQTYTADTLTLDIDDGDFYIKSPSSLWAGTSLYKLYEQAYTPWEWHKPIMELCEELGIICFSTPFDESAVDLLEELRTPCYKIASFENIHLPLIKKVASTGKPIIISTGMATLTELDEAIREVKSTGNNNIILLKCTSSYPATPENSNINTIPHLRQLFNVEVGLSDHTLGIGVAVASVALGAVVIEKHFTLSRSEGGVDAAFSLEPAELKNLVDETERAWLSLGEIVYGPTESEKTSIQFRRSLYIAEDMQVGDVLNTKNLRVVRPGYGLAPKYYDLLLGKKVKHSVKKGTPLKWELII